MLLLCVCGPDLLILQGDWKPRRVTSRTLVDHTQNELARTMIIIAMVWLGPFRRFWKSHAEKNFWTAGSWRSRCDSVLGPPLPLGLGSIR